MYLAVLNTSTLCISPLSNSLNLRQVWQLTGPQALIVTEAHTWCTSKMTRLGIKSMLLCLRLYMSTTGISLVRHTL